jgi:hypothetical protein
MTPVFADSFYFFALLNPRDPAHPKAVAFTQSYTAQLVTTGWAIPGGQFREFRREFRGHHTQL